VLALKYGLFLVTCARFQRDKSRKHNNLPSYLSLN
jgi:hypothetical protein